MLNCNFKLYKLWPFAKWLNILDVGCGGGQFIKDLMENFKEDDRLITSKIESKEAIYRSLKEFLGKGK